MKKTKIIKKSPVYYLAIVYLFIWFLVSLKITNAQNSSLNGKEYLNIYSGSYCNHNQLVIYITTKDTNEISIRMSNPNQGILSDTLFTMLPNETFAFDHYYFPIGLDNLDKIEINSTEFLYVYNSNFLFNPVFEVGALIPKQHKGSHYIVPGVYNKGGASVQVLPYSEYSDFNITTTSDVLMGDNYLLEVIDSISANVPYSYNHQDSTYFAIGSFDYDCFAGQFTWDTLSVNKLLGGSVIRSEYCNKFEFIANHWYISSYPWQYQSYPIIDSICTQMRNTIYGFYMNPANDTAWRPQAVSTVLEDLFPVNTMGQQYICSPPPNGCEIVSFTAPYDNTIIRINNEVWDTLNLGDSRVKLFTEPAYIDASYPISAVISHSFMKDSVGWFWGGGGLVQIPAIEQFAQSGWFFYPSEKFLTTPVNGYHLPATYFANEKSYMVVVTPSSGANQTLLNNINIGSQFSPIAGNPQYSSARIEITTGFNELSNPNGLVAWSSSYQTRYDAIAQLDDRNYQFYGAPLVMSFNKPTYDAKISSIPIDSTLIEAYAICLDAELQFSVTNSNNSDIYINTWEFGDGHTAVGDTVFHSFADTGYFHINLFVNNFCDTIKGLVYVVPPPEFSLGNDTIICANIPLILDATIPENASYLWNDDSTNPQITVDAIGEYIVEIHTDNACYVTDTINIDMYDPINLFLGNDTILCHLSSLVLDATQPPSAEANYMWQDYSTNSTYTVIYEGQYWVVVENLCTQERDTINVEELMYPELNLGNDTLICIGNTLLLDATIPWGVSYIWEDGTSGAYRQVESEGLYWVEASNPCVSVVDSIFVDFDDCSPLLFMPNVFTPNGDGVNDIFAVGDIENISKLNIMIFNRWGQKLFESNSANFEWDGKYNGKECSEGVYYWVINYEDIFGKSHEANGTVSLLR